VDTGLLDVLHHRADEHVDAVAHRVDVNLDRPLQEAIDQDGVFAGGFGRGPNERRELVVVVDDLHSSTAEDVGGSHHDRVADPAGDETCLVDGPRLPVRGRRDLHLVEELREPPSVLRQIDRVRRGAQDAVSRSLEDPRQLERGLTTELRDHADRSLRVTDGEHVLGRQRLEVQTARCVVVRGHGLRIRVDHHGVEPRLVQRERGMDTRVVELDPLPDPVRPRPEDHDARAGSGRDLGLLFVGGVVVRRGGGELAAARVHGLEDREDPE
jgi:hypothetical protein